MLTADSEKHIRFLAKIYDFIRVPILAKIIKQLQPLTIFASKALLYMVDWFLNVPVIS